MYAHFNGLLKPLESKLKAAISVSQNEASNEKKIFKK
jgi:hypothetical protein